MTPAQHFEVLDCLRIAREEGARLALGGSAPTAAECGNGRFVEPTVLTGVRDTCTSPRRSSAPSRGHPLHRGGRSRRHRQRQP
ncbi:aldehyde dehydrogenase family protein [Streptomyces sp. AC04842]|nr:aldehyde dehydrogenase family protein [Streptomyces sp. AC04842]